MPQSLDKLLENNKKWIKGNLQKDPDFYRKLASVHEPEYLWIGCSDARVPANEITGTAPGEVFVHRNIANQVVHTDMNVLSVLSYAVEILKVKHIIVCGHYGCGGVAAALSNKKFGLIDNWLRHLKDIFRTHAAKFESLNSQDEKQRLLVELNVREQVYNICKTSIIQETWKHSEFPYVHGLVYDIHDGELKNLNVSTNNNNALKQVYKFED